MKDRIKNLKPLNYFGFGWLLGMGITTCLLLTNNDHLVMLLPSLVIIGYCCGNGFVTRYPRKVTQPNEVLKILMASKHKFSSEFSKPLELNYDWEINEISKGWFEIKGSHYFFPNIHCQIKIDTQRWCEEK